MFKTSRIEKMVKLCLISGFLKRDIAPLSLMLIAPPESNKTSILKKFEGMKNVKYTVDLSSKPLIKFLEDASKEKFYHIIIPDFVKVVRHNQNTVNSVIATLNASMEEGIKESMYYGQEIKLKKNVQIGLITSITPELYIQQFKLWNEIGFLSRFVNVSYKYSEETRQDIMRLITGDASFHLDEEFSSIKKGGKKDIKMSKDMAEVVRFLVDDVVKRLQSFSVTTYKGDVKRVIKLDIQGFRLLKQMLLLTKCIAFDKGLDEVNGECINELKILLDYVTMPNSPKLI